jgi:hypothetical protein
MQHNKEREPELGKFNRKKKNKEINCIVKTILDLQ